MVLHRLRQFLVSILAAIFVLAVAGVALMWWAGIQFQAQAETFWGAEYQPGVFNSTEVTFPFPETLLIAEGGPIIAESFAACPDGMPPFMVPLRVASEEEFEVLCGLGNNVSIQRRSLRDYSPMVQEVFRKHGDEASR